MSRVQRSIRFGMMLALVGGFLDAYSYLNAGGLFAGAQTGNVVILSVHLTSQEWHESLRTLIPIVSFAGGSAVGAAFYVQAAEESASWPAKATLMLEIVLLGLVVVPPFGDSDALAILLLSFVSGLQMAVFRNVRDWAFTSTVTTNNITKWMSSVVEMVTTDDASDRLRTVAFTGIIVSFIGGAILAGLLTLRFDAFAIFGASGVLLLGLAWLLVSD